MKKAILLLAMIIMFVGCGGENAYITYIKESSFDEQIKTTMEQVLDKTFTDKKWSHFKNENNRNVVQFEGKFNNDKSKKIAIQWGVGEDLNEYDLVFFKIDGVSYGVMGYTAFFGTLLTAFE